MTRHLRQGFNTWEKIAGLDEGEPFTVCGIELMDLEPGDVVAKDANCPRCLNPAPTLLEELLALRAWKAKLLPVLDDTLALLDGGDIGDVSRHMDEQATLLRLALGQEVTVDFDTSEHAAWIMRLKARG